MKRDDGASSLPEHVRVGTILAGKYRIERVVGRGGMGVVVAAMHLGLRQTVAVKLLLPKTHGQPNLAARMLREARAAAALKGEHVARVFDVDVLDDGSPYIVMEYLEGQTLGSRLKEVGRLDIAATVDFALQACEALAEAHALGIVHRDLKPANLHLARAADGGDKLRVLDFGISKALDVEWRDSMQADTDSHAFIGSPPYVSPEQLLNPGEVDARTDIWSIGIVLYECLAGRPPFQGRTLARLWDAILREEPPPFEVADRTIEAELQSIVRRCLAKKPADRFPSVLELAQALVPFAPMRSQASVDAVKAALARARPVDLASRGHSGSLPVPMGLDETRTEGPLTRSLTAPSRAGSKTLFARLSLVVMAAGVLIGSIGWRLWNAGKSRSAPPDSVASVVAAASKLAVSTAAPRTSPVTTLGVPSAEGVSLLRSAPSAARRGEHSSVAAPKPVAGHASAPTASSQKPPSKYVDER